jgi:hypothetical protein
VSEKEVDCFGPTQLEVRIVVSGQDVSGLEVSGKEVSEKDVSG